MELLTIFVLVVTVVTAVALWRRVSRRQDGSLDRRAAVELPYERNSVLLSAAERSFLGVLEQALGEGYRVCPKVRVADAISVRRPLPRGEWQRAFNRISSKHFDFILCRSTDLEIACAVELDDSTHQRNDRQERDMFLGEVCSVSSLPLLRFPAKGAYTVSDIQGTVSRLHGLAAATVRGRGPFIGGRRRGNCTGGGTAMPEVFGCHGS